MSTMTVRIAVLGALIGALVLPASAQEYFPGTDPADANLISQSMLNTRLGNHMVQQAVERNNRRGGRTVRKTRVSATRAATMSSSSMKGMRLAPAGAAALSYRPNPAIREEAKRAFVARIAKMNPAVGPKLTQAMKSFDMFAQYRKMVGEEGYRQNNAADAVASTIVAAWMTSKGKFIDMDNAGQRVIRARIATALLADPRMKSAAFRQRLGDESQLTTVFLLSGLTGATQQGSTAGYAAAMGSLFKSLTGVEASRVKLTSQGFVPI